MFGRNMDLAGVSGFFKLRHAPFAEVLEEAPVQRMTKSTCHLAIYSIP
jgi:hypothetical protein